MTVSTPTRRTIHRIFALFTSLGLLFATTNLAAQDQSTIEPPPGGPDDAIQLEHEETPPIQTPSSDDPAAIDLEQPVDNTQSLEINNAVDAFSQFVTSFQRDLAYKTYTNTYAIRGLRTLNETLGAMIRPGDDKLIREQKALYNRIVTIETMPNVEREAQTELVYDAFIDTATLFIKVQRQYYPDYDRQAQEIGRIAASLSTDSSLKDQAEEVNFLLLAASNTLENMARQPLNPIGGGPLDNPGQRTQNEPTYDPEPDPIFDPTIDPTIDPNVSDDIEDPPYNDDLYDDDNDIDDTYRPQNPATDPGPLYPPTPIEPVDPLDPTYPVDPTEPLDPTDPMEITPLGPAQPFDPTNPEETAPLDF